MLVTSEYSGEKLQSYFWLYADIGEVGLKKNRFRTLSELLHGHRCLGGHDFPFLKENDILSPQQRHLTFLEQDKPQRFSTEHTDQPVTSSRDIKYILEDIRAIFAKEAGSLRLSGQSIETRIGRKKASLQLTFNEESVNRFSELHEQIIIGAARYGMTDFYAGRRMPHVTLASAPIYKKPRRVTEAFAKAVQDDLGRIKTQAVTVDRLVLGQSFRTTDGKRYGERVVADVNMAEASLQWHCEDPFEPTSAGRLVAEAMQEKMQEKRRHRLYMAA